MVLVTARCEEAALAMTPTAISVSAATTAGQRKRCNRVPPWVGEARRRDRARPLRDCLCAENIRLGTGRGQQVVTLPAMRGASPVIVALVLAVGLSGGALAAAHSEASSGCKIAPKHAWTSCPHGNLAGRDLVQADLRNADLTGANLTGARLTRANLATARLVRAKLTRARLDLANLTFANLVGAFANDANLSRATLNGGNLAHVNLSGANLFRANLASANLVGANLAHANLGAANLAGANLDGANLTGAILNTASLVGTNLSHAKLTPSRARERDVERRVSDRGKSLGRKPAGRGGDGSGSLEGEPLRRETRERRLVRRHLPERAEDDDSLLSPGAWFRRGRSGRSECSCCRSRRSTSPARGRRRTGLCPRSPPGHSPRRRTSRGRAR